MCVCVKSPNNNDNNNNNDDDDDDDDDNARAELTLRLGTAMLLSRAATVIAAMVRGRLGRRRQLTFTALRIVQGAHAQLLKEVRVRP